MFQFASRAKTIKNCPEVNEVIMHRLEKIKGSVLLFYLCHFFLFVLFYFWFFICFDVVIVAGFFRSFVYFLLAFVMS